MPLNYTAPGVYVEELPKISRPIEQLPTGVVAFLGSARAGASYRAFEIKSFTEFTARFGALKTEMELGYAVRQFFANGGARAWVVRVAQKATTSPWQRGLAALDKVERFDLLVLPGVEEAGVRDEALRYAQSRRAFFVLDAPRAATSVMLMRDAVKSLPVSADAAVYFPWVETDDPAAVTPGAKRVTAPAGGVAGVMARIDVQRGVWKAPAGAEATLSGALGLTVHVNDQDGGDLNVLGVNCLREFAGQGRVVFGARTLAGANNLSSEWKYIPVRRLALLLESSLERGLQWAVFEPNDEPLWIQIRASVTDLLLGLWRQGALSGLKPEEAFFVKCDRITMTQADISAGAVKVMIGFAPVKPTEFIVLNLTLRAAGN